MANDIGEILGILLSFKESMYLYHLQTTSYARHKASDKLVDSISDLSDKFIESMQGSRNYRASLKPNSVIVENQDDSSIVVLLNDFSKWLQGKLPLYLTKSDTDLLNIRDEMLAATNKTKYLFTLE